MLSTEADPWDARRARKRLLATGALTKLGGRWVTTPTMLVEATGNVGLELLSCFDSREL